MNTQASNTESLQRNQSGMVSIMVTMILMIVMSLIVVGFAQVSRRNQRVALDRQLSTQAFYAAESGVNDAREFLDAYGKRVELRYPGAQANEPSASPDAPERTLSWKTNEGAVIIKRSGSNVFIMEGLPDGVDPFPLLTLLKQ